MRVRKTALVIPFVLSTVTCSIAQAQTSSPPTRFTIGAKVWHASWMSYVPALFTGIGANGVPTVGDSINGAEGEQRTNVMPQVALSNGKYFASASHGRFSSDFHVPTSPIITPGGQNLITSRTDHFKRRETDLNVGYSLTPEIGIVLSYKDATETRDTSLGIAPQRTPIVSTKVKGYLLGAVGNFAVYDKLRLYVQAGYGPARFKLRFTDPTLGAPKADGSYIIGELGLSYPIYSNANGNGGVTAAIGYRTQTVKTDSYALQDKRELRDVRDGAVVSLNFTL